jgi:hypothetical protein
LRRARLMAQTLMIFDDHDVTDDWNLPQKRPPTATRSRAASWAMRCWLLCCARLGQPSGLSLDGVLDDMAAMAAPTPEIALPRTRTAWR